MASAGALVRKLRSNPADALRFACGRFPAVRRGYSLVRATSDPPAAAPSSPHRSYVKAFDIDEAVERITHDSVYLPIQLVDDALAALASMGGELAVRNPDSRLPTMTVREVLDHNRREPGRPFLYGSVPEAHDSAIVRAILDDPQIVAAASRYLGYTPRRRRPRLQWSFVCEMRPEERMRFGQTVFYHYDADDFNFVYVTFYVTETDRESGAHVMIRNSHRRKPISWLFGRTWRTDEEVFARYQRSQEMVITGTAGSGFIQDSSCMHKALAPLARPRLVLQLRYS